ncbi:hypothetical protein FGU71_05155 [Erythrobacter insulae]|uniref:Peptidase M48 domain-containing protein n=1 Tax=Erythrobacter insulae TaxID=2584124 RepID=A0A547PAX5_9SPHN|nr:hypothetical protein [Erythrobacter insulae]TRD11293.1 hypothetical protein FGU71_05155 [Erythrobacter insulae]
MLDAWRWLTGCALAAMLASPAAASAPDPADVDLSAERAAIARFQDADQLLQDIGWRLVRGNADFCPDPRPSIGLQLQDLASYGEPDIARAALGLERDFAVQTAARGSPAALEGAFARNREITRIGDTDPNALKAGARLEWKRLVQVHDAIDGALKADGSTRFTFGDGSTAAPQAVSVCQTRFELSNEGERAVADGKRVVIGARFDGFALGEGLLAAAIAHELAHNLLAHRDWLDRNGRKRRNIRATEREADRLMPWLLANAGYDPAAAAQFFREYKPQNGGAFLLRGSHDQWQDRAEAVETQSERISALRKAGERPDWSVHVGRLIDPDKGRAKP